MRFSKIFLTFVITLTVLAVTGCSRIVLPGSTETVTERVERAGAERVAISVRPTLGSLTLTGGTADLFEGNFTYNLDRLEPEVSYSVENGVGTLDVGHRNTSFNVLPVGNVRNEWTLRLGDDIPIALDLALGLGDSAVDLRDVELTDLVLQSGAGDVQVDLGQQEMERVRVQAGLGDIALRLGGGRIDRFDFNAGAGRVVIDFTGDWQDNLEANVHGGLGDLELIVPNDVAVRIDVNSGLGDVEANGFRLDDGAYVNDAYGTAGPVLNIDVNQGAGDVTLNLVE